MSALQAVEIVDVDGLDGAEQHHQDRQPDRRLRRGDGEYEEHENLPVRIAKVVREGDEIHVDGEQHQLDRHQQDDDVLAVEKYPDDADREQHRAENQEMRQGQQGLPLFSFYRALQSFCSDAIDTRRTRSPRRAAICVAGSWYLVSLRLRSVSAMAAMMATSSSTAASSKG